MRYIYIALIGLVAVIALLFTLQNLETVTIVFFSANITLPTSILVFLVYVLGMVTGGSLGWLLRSWLHGATRNPKAHD
jgi:putative membrane protein